VWDGRTPITTGDELRWLLEWYTAYYQHEDVWWQEDQYLSVYSPWEMTGLSDADEGGVLLCSRCDIEADAPVTDDTRRLHRRHLVEGLGQDSAAPVDIVLMRLPGAYGSAFLAYRPSGSSWEGVALDWLGVFPSRDSLTSYLRSWGWIFSSEDIDEAAEQRFLALWDRNDFEPGEQPRQPRWPIGMGAKPPAFRMLCPPDLSPPYV
jgi:hypothetical protein